ncbi:la-related protein 1B [Zea mays]|uniref:HTH La-type RNA-binding domain-containing protein n=1 Tax=Zea mays TaxID=4577 RepID=A0A804QIW4_MAIZE|nr:la-related protein 1B [Zea mays]|eukprot:XP_020396724.1 la-related protein 1B isoform X1 [Zea mays]
MSPAAGGPAPAPAPAQSAAAVPQAIAVPPESGRSAPEASRRDPPAHPEGADPTNAAARKTTWSVLAQTPAAAAEATPEGGGIIGGDASWPALVESTRACPKSGSSDSLNALSDVSGPPPQEDTIAASSVLPHPVVGANPIPTAQNPTSIPPRTPAASSQQNGATTQTFPVRRSGNRGNGSNGGVRAANSSGGDGSSGSGGDGNWNDGSLGTDSGCNSSNGDGPINLDDNVPGTRCARGNDNDSSRNPSGNGHWNHNIRGGGGGGDGNNRNSSGSSNHWNNNPRNSSSSNGVGGRGGYRGRRDHERGANFSPRNFPRVPVMPYQQQQQPGIYQPGPFHRPPPPAAHFMVPQHFYVPSFPYLADVQPYPVYLPPVEQFQNMHLLRPPMQPAWVPPHQDQPNLQDSIRNQIEFYFSTNNLCHDTFLRRHMNNQGWVPIDLILGFNRMRAFTGLVDTNYILDAIRGSELLEVQGDNVRRRNDWMEWLLH